MEIWRPLPLLTMEGPLLLLWETSTRFQFNPRYPIVAQIFCAFSPVNVMSSCNVALRSK